MSHDILSDVLRNVRLRGAIYYYVSGKRSWAAEAPPAREIAAAVMPESEHVMEYHVVTHGACWSAVVGEAPVRLEAGDVVLFPQGDPHVMSSAPGMRAPVDAASYVERKQDQLPFTLHLDATEMRVEVVPDELCDTILVCGFLGCDLRPFNPLIATLPRLMHVRAHDGHDWVAQFMRQAVTESKNKRAGGEAMLERMSELMFIDAVRRYVEALPEDSSGWLAGLRDRFVGRALALMHESPATAWTVDELGRQVGLSRSALHERFAEMIGQGPMQYLANWRIQVGAALLRNTSATVAAVAQEVGYESEATFTRAFKRLVGKPPGVWRRGGGVGSRG
ncbi:MAG TPA: AraC family transcriptional regulator [Steroidobacteraceae bacterium]|jgi:AraC-like DNA-binding protein|nr:AraC family transcriptional regulator [Steroidobacteraceae bacterium]HVX90643.1 AraC family transcriptional regulator [Candidatus Paceibacterota bacterium]